jgi:hypothetical protein
VKFKVCARRMDPNDVDEDGDANEALAPGQPGNATSADDTGNTTHQRRLAERCEALHTVVTDLMQFLGNVPAGKLNENGVQGIRKSLPALR